MSNFVRSSKYRHVYCDPPKPHQTISGFRLSSTTGEQSYIKCSSKYLSVSVSGGGGPFVVHPINDPGRKANFSKVVGHSGAVLDTDWNPFDDDMVASASEDGTIKIWQVPKEGMIENITTPIVDLRGHGRKVTLLRFNPTASSVLASTGGDQTVKIWDIEQGNEITTFSGNTDLSQDIVWDCNGDNLAVSCKDKNVRIIDGRNSAASSVIQAPHEGSKSVKLAYLGSTTTIASVGFTRQSQRELKIWDLRNVSTGPLKKIDIDQAAGVIMPFYDPDTSVLYLSGKGDGNVRYYEYVKSDPYCFPLSEFRSTTSCKGMCMVPKRALDVMNCETARMLKLTPNDGVQQLRFTVPRKSEMFQEDIFPPTYAGVPAHTADEWREGSSKSPVTMSLNPSSSSDSVLSRSGSSSPKPFKTVATLTKDLNDAEEKIKKLEGRIRNESKASEERISELEGMLRDNGIEF